MKVLVTLTLWFGMVLCLMGCSSSGVNRSYTEVVPAPVGWTQQYAHSHDSSSWRGPSDRYVGRRNDRQVISSFPQPRDYFRPIVVQGQPGWRYEAPQRSRKGRR